MSQPPVSMPDELAVRAAQNLMIDGGHFRDAIRAMNEWSHHYGVVLVEGFGGWWHVGDVEKGRLWSNHLTFALAVSALLEACAKRIASDSQSVKQTDVEPEDPNRQPTTYIHGAA